MIDAERQATSTPEEMVAEMIRLRREIDAFELSFSQLAAAYAQTDHWDDEGSNSAIDFIRFSCHMTDNAAAARVAVGEQLARMPEACRPCMRARSATRT
jgi:hypothetical protein